MSKKILITGCTGYVGANLAAFLLEKKYEVVGIGRRKIESPFAFYQCDIRDSEKISEIINKEGIDVIFHLAALLKSENKKETWDINVNGTKSVTNAFSESEAEKIIFSSSGKVYGNVKTLPTPENHPINPTSMYGKSKASAEEILKEVKYKQVVILRQTYLYGKGMSEKFLIPSIIAQIKENNKITLKNTEVKRDFVHIKDILELYEVFINKKMQYIKTYNVSCGKSIQIRKIIDIISKYFHKEIEIENLKKKEENIEELLDISKIKSELGWEPKISYEGGLKMCIE